MTFTQGAGVWRPGGRSTMYSRPSCVNPPVPLAKIKSSRGDIASTGPSDATVRCTGASIKARAGRGARRPALQLLPREPSASRITIRAAACSNTRSSSEKPSTCRTNTPPGLSTSWASVPAAMSSRIWSFSSSPVARGVLVPDHQVGQQAAHPPVGVRPEQIAHQLQPIGIADSKQHDGQIARDPESPQSRLALAVALQDAAGGTPDPVSKDHGGCQLPEVPSLRFAGPQATKDGSAVGRRGLEHAIDHPVILIFRDQGHRCVPRRRDADDQVELRATAGRQFHRAPDRDTRVQHGPGRSRQAGPSRPARRVDACCDRGR